MREKSFDIEFEDLYFIIHPVSTNTLKNSTMKISTADDTGVVDI